MVFARIRETETFTNLRASMSCRLSPPISSQGKTEAHTGDAVETVGIFTKIGTFQYWTMAVSSLSGPLRLRVQSRSRTRFENRGLYHILVSRLF